MSNIQPGSKQFKNLQAKWYHKLEKTGFKDIEKDESLVEWDSIRFAKPSNINGKEKLLESREYFLQTQNLINRDIFIDRVERRIWELHSAGKSIRQIVRAIADEGIEKNKNEVNQVINEFQRMLLK